MKKFITLAICLMASIGCYAQSYFEGTLKARSYEEHSNIMIKSARGTLCNGARDAALHVKGQKLLVEDHLTNINTLYTVDNDEMYLIFHNVKKAVKLSCSNFQKSLDQTNREPAKPTQVVKTLTGKPCRLYTWSNQNKVGTVNTILSTETYVCEELPIDPALAPIASNTKQPYLFMKYVVKTDIKAPIASYHSYTAFEVKEVIPTTLDEALFTVPAGYEIVDGVDRKAMLKVYDDNLKVMKKAKKDKEKPVEIKFDINEEWDF